MHQSLFESLFDEAEFAFLSENFDVGVVRLEALLSSIHKFLLLHAPHSPSIVSRNLDSSSAPTPKLIGIGGTSILIVDDERGVTDTISEMLTRDGFRVAKAYNGKEALEAMVENDYHLLITDLQLPFLDGREVAIGARAISPKTKIMLITGFEELAKKAAMLPYDKILRKPFDHRELIESILDLLDPKSV